jgi:hypothetical protein
VRAQIVCVVAFVSTVLGITGVHAGEVPKPPEGFTWLVSKNKVGAFLRPNGWFVKEEGKKSDKGLFITKENIDKSGQFITGLTVNMVPRVKSRTGVLPNEYAKAFLAKYSSNKQFDVLKSYSVQEQNGYEGFGLRYSGDNKGVITIVNVLVVASNNDDILYIFVFEAPKKIWDAEWKKGEVMLNIFALGE